MLKALATSPVELQNMHQEELSQIKGIPDACTYCTKQIRQGVPHLLYKQG